MSPSEIKDATDIVTSLSPPSRGQRINNVGLRFYFLATDATSRGSHEKRIQITREISRSLMRDYNDRFAICRNEAEIYN